MFNTGFDRGTAGFPSPTVCPRTDGLPVCNHTWTTGLPPAVSMGDFRQQNALGRCYLPAAPAGHPQSPFPPSPLNSSGVSTNSSPFPKTPADSAFAYYGYGPFLRRNQGGQAPSAVTMEQARAADFHFQPVNAVPSPDTARVFSSRTLSSPPPHDNAEIKFRATSPPDSGERWSAATNDQTEPSFREPQSQGQAGPQAGPTGKDAKLGQELARNDTTPRVAEGPPKPRPKIRTPRPLDPDTKTRICETRRMGACLRCHNQRAKCEPNKDDPGNPLAPCTTCQGVKKGTKKTIHNLPCFRYKLTEILLYRCGGLGYTKRFTHEELVDIEGIGEQHVVYMTSDFAKTAIKLEVRLFQPSPDDILVRRFLDDDGVPREVPLPPYCLASIKKTSEEFDKYIQERALNGLLEAAENVDVPVIIRRTFEMIAKYCDALTETVTVKRKQGQEIRPNDQKELLLEAVRLWFAIRHGIGTSTLSGEGSEGLEPIHVQASAFPKGTAPNMPRMIVAQFDSIRHVRIYKRLFPKVLKLLEKVLTSKNMGAWFTAYLVTFLFLDLVGSASEDRHRWAHANSGGKPLESRYGTSHLAGFVEDLHWAGVVILMHWHYFKRVDLLDMKEWESPGKTALKWLNPEEVNFVKHTVLDLRLELDEIPTTPGEGCWDNSMFWVSQMFRSTSPSDYKWAPPEIFAREKPSVGRDTPHLSCRRRKPKRR
ncbi:hypothetical protein B0T14DRAFT_207330 [Immersiella caudata]|uniref:Zn(2)-C6 fungal-type domain-containing protein n=1 Tax=Immersiella caudata TaxID=314043 RepID=A0AA39WPT8_9PEZI|nr:hypothetical protein B0T14DRAFT_207330 [Immersiella caudata]